MQENNFAKVISDALNKEYFSYGKARIRSWEAIFLIGIISGFVGGIIWIESNTSDFDFDEVSWRNYYIAKQERSLRIESLPIEEDR